MIKSRENRVPIMMSDEEVRAVDDWRFNNRIATRSEAVRRLCRIGISVDDWVNESELQATNAMGEFLEAIQTLGDFSIEQREPINRIWNALTDIQLLVGQVSVVARTMRVEGDLNSALLNADQYRQKFIEEKDFETRRRLGLIKGEEK